MISSDLSAQHVPHSTPFLSVASNRQSIDFSSIHIYSRSDWCTIESDPGVFVSFMLSGTSPATSFIVLICPICHALDVPLSRKSIFDSRTLYDSLIRTPIINI